MLLRTKIAFGIAAAFIFVTVGLLIGGIVAANKIEETYLAITSKEVQSVLETQLKSPRSNFDRHAKTIGRERNALAALAEGNIAELKEELQSTFNRISANGEISDLLIFDKEGQLVANFAGEGTPDLTGMVKQILADGKRMDGFARLGESRSAYVLSFPLLKGRNKVGVGVVGLDFKNVLGTLSSALGGDVVMWIDQKLIGQSNSEIVDEQLSAFHTEIGESQRIDFQEETLLVSLASANNAEGTSTAQFHVVQNVTEQYQAAAFDVLMIRAAVIAVAILLLAGLVFWIGKQFSPLAAITNLLEKLANDDHDAEADVKSNSAEILALMEALGLFRAKAVEQERLAQEVAKTAAKDRAKTEQANALQEQIREVTSAAMAGDFSKQIEIDPDNKDSVEIGSQINAMLSVNKQALEAVRDVLKDLGEKNLTSRVVGNYTGAFKLLQDDTNLVADQLSAVINGLRTTSGALRSATGEILEGANDLAERTTRQAAAIEQTSAATEQLADTVRDNTMRAQEAQVSAEKSRDVAHSGGAEMAKANEAMQRITASSNKISDIIGMIDDIAFQTNLLALNASVEAARAGEAGKGFAVVAVEVRRLAQSAAEASSEVKVLIEQSVAEVSQGTNLVAKASENLDGIVKGVNEVTNIIEGIAKESQEQSTAITEISTAIREMDEMTQHNAALVEQTNAAIDQTEGQATELDGIIDGFKTLNVAGATSGEVQEDQALAS